LAKIFISYASADRLIVENLQKDLAKHNYSLWVDFNNISGGTLWEQEITNAVSQCTACIVIVTRESTKSEWVQKEIDIARRENKLIIPLIMDDISPGKSVKTLNVSDLQYIDFFRFGYDVGFRKLLNTIPDAEETHEGISGHVLIIEDEAQPQDIIQTVLQDLRFQTVVADDFRKALDVIRSQHFDLVTLDMQLDIMDQGGQKGFLLLEQLKSYQKSVPIIIISGIEWTGSEVGEFFMEYGIAAYVKKPFKPKQVRSAVEKLFRK
jgi:CheY-like chemotaxis protein